MTVRADQEYDNSSSGGISLTQKFSAVITSEMLAPGRHRRVSQTSNHQQLTVTVRILNNTFGIVRHSFDQSWDGGFTPLDRILYQVLHAIIITEDRILHQGDIIDITTKITTDISASTFTGVQGLITLLVELDV